MKQAEQLLWGRRVTARELAGDRDNIGQSPMIPVIKATTRGFMCQRCGNTRHFYPNRCLCDSRCMYCLDCVAFGVLRRCDVLYDLPAPAVNDWRR